MVRVRALAALIVLGLCLAGCGTSGGGPPRASGPQSAAPTATEPAGPTAPGVGPSVSPSGSATASPSASTTTPARTTVKYVFPVKASNVAFHPTHSKYPATDIFADCGEPVVATTSGVILEVSLTDRYVEGSPDGPYNGGLSVSLLGDDGVRYYGSHLSKVRSGIRAGVRVTAGQRLGDVGRTGNANNVCHLHYGISPPCARTGDWEVRRGVVWPAGYLTSWRRKGSLSPVAKVKAWQKAHHCTA